MENSGQDVVVCVFNPHIWEVGAEANLVYTALYTTYTYAYIYTHTWAKKVFILSK